MRTITLSNQTLTVNPLKGKDIRALKADGIDLMTGSYQPVEKIISSNFERNKII